MIDWIAFIDSLDEDSFDDIVTAVHARRVDEAEGIAQTIVLSFSEVQLARKTPIAAVAMVMHRLRCDPLVAKAAVEMVGEADVEEALREDGGEDPFPPGDAADDFTETLIGADMQLVD